MEQFSKEEAKAISDSRVWTQWTDIQILRLQLFQTHLCMPFGTYHRALERCLGRPVYTNTIEYNKPKLIKEFLSIATIHPFEEIMESIPQNILNRNSTDSNLQQTLNDYNPKF